MFTGLIETTGAVASVKKTGNGIRLSLRPLKDFQADLGDSISINGVCLTVTKHSKGVSQYSSANPELAFDISPETMRSTNLGELKLGDQVNLERALKLSDRLGGHIVTGHVDGIGVIKDKKLAGEYTFYTFETSPDILKYVVKKGSVAVDGISLTVVELDKRSFNVAIIPHTLTATNIGNKGPGNKVNLEVDIIGKYVERLLNRKDPDNSLSELLKKEGFVK